jgi:hypothetical protein
MRRIAAPTDTRRARTSARLGARVAANMRGTGTTATGASSIDNIGRTRSCKHDSYVDFITDQRTSARGYRRLMIFLCRLSRTAPREHPRSATRIRARQQRRCGGAFRLHYRADAEANVDPRRRVLDARDLPRVPAASARPVVVTGRTGRRPAVGFPSWRPPPQRFRTCAI